MEKARRQELRLPERASARAVGPDTRDDLGDVGGGPGKPGGGSLLH